MTNRTDFKAYPHQSGLPDYPKLEEDILAFWKEKNIFQKSIDTRPADNEFVFYDGPPFANGLPHYGHMVTGFIKDIIPRYQTMKGKRVERRFGWDCHGLPAELQAEKELGISGRYEIINYGIDKFNHYCHDLVTGVNDAWDYYVERQARWVDMENSYRTMDLSFMESVMWAFKTLHDKGLIYEDYRIVPYSWAVETPLSNFETKLDDAYRMRQDPAVTVKFKLDKDIDGKPTYILAWTTTPWTLPSNLALAVHPDLEYAVIEKDGENYIVATDRIDAYKKEFGNSPSLIEEHVSKLSRNIDHLDEDNAYSANAPLGKKGVDALFFMGHELKDLTYEPLFPYFAHLKEEENAFRVLVAEYVSAEDGTGIVHQAPGFGEEDLANCRAAGISVVVPIDSTGKFTSEVKDYEGMLWMDANKPIMQRLKEEGKMFRQETIDHNYPHCWRTDTPLIYKAINSWYVKVTAFKDRMVELNQGISWVPEHIRDGAFGKWLENARDWNIGRNRFWGSPVPVWKSDNPDYPRLDVYGSIEDLQKDFGTDVTDLHRPAIDNLTRPNPDDPTGKSTMRRVEDVLDCWFESGSMPFAQVHYPFENKDWFDNHFPGDFIVEYIAQTRGWFYTLMVMSTALFDRAPFQNCICHGVVLDENKQKLSKRLKNYPDPVEVFNTFGADALRWYMVSTPLMTGGDLAIPKDGAAIGQIRNQIMNPIWNAYSFYALYANADQIRGEIITKAGENVLDRYILAKTHEMVEKVTIAMDSYIIPDACEAIRGYLDALNNWYIRRSRDRFWGAEKTQDKLDAYNTLYTVLVTLCKTAAPFLPMLSEKIYQNLTGEESVHLSDWIKTSALPADEPLVAAMDRVREVCSLTLGIREVAKLRVRLPLNELVIAANDAAALRPYTDLIADEVNVKQVILSDELSKFGKLELKVNPAIGKKVGGAMKDIMPAAKSGSWTDHGDGTITVAGHTLSAAENDYTMQLVTGEGTTAQQLSGQGAVILDTTVTPELEAEGLARDLIRMIQQTRKEADLHVSDRISLSIQASDRIIATAKTYTDFIKTETLADNLQFDTGEPSGGFSSTQELQGDTVKVSLLRLKAA
ncbi:MAG: isoleucine--tRNA ligase [Rhodospirillales bacterium]|nr:isoleucine--tRNA ligase [Rhodospirillales bacterium]